MSLLSKSWVWGIVFAVVGLGVMGVMSIRGYPGVEDDCIRRANCYCEMYSSPTVEPTGIKQVSNSVSALVSIGVGIAILFWVEGKKPRPFTEHPSYPIAYGFLVIFLGLGSLYFHASLTRIGGFVDNLSMTLYITFLLLYNVYRVLREESHWVYFLVMFGLLNSIAAIPTYAIDGLGTQLFTALVIVYVGMEAWILIVHPAGIRRRGSSFAAALGVFALATVIWRLSWTGGAWCDPNSLIQGHAVWHVLSMAVAPALLFVYLLSETRPSPDDHTSAGDNA